jgi:hypothetical protein
MYLESYHFCAYIKVSFGFKVNYSAVQNGPVYSFLKSDLIPSSVSTFDCNSKIYSVAWMMMM